MVTASIHPALEDLIEFLAKLAPRKVLNYKASAKSQERLTALLEKNKDATLSAEETTEIQYYMMVEHLVRLAKARALQKLNVRAV